MLKLKNVMLAVAAIVLAACSGGGSDNTLVNPGSGGGGGGGGGGGAPATAAITVSSDVTSIPSDGSVTATITAYVTDVNNALVSGVPVSFQASSGGISAVSPVTGDGGTAIANLVTAGDPTLRTITVTASAGSLQATVAVQVVTSSTSSVVQMGNGTGGSFVPNAIGISNANLSAGGSTSLTISLVQSDSTLYTGSANISFNSPCVANGSAQIRQNGVAVSSINTTTGLATVTYVAQGCNGADTITATSTVGGQALSASGTVTVAMAAVGSIEFVSATPTNIALQGTGDSLRPETSTVVFQVKDATDGPVQGATVNFSLNTTVGGITLTATSATSDNQGFVQTIVNAGTVATSVRVTATVASTAISTQSSRLTITTGIPTDQSFSLAVQCFNIEGLEYDGVTTTVTARLGDRFQNPAPDGTAVTFTAEGGNIESQCTTETTATEGGVCTVDFRSSNPRPANGRISILAKAIGEESFTDQNGDGKFQDGEAFFDLAEAYRDDNENSAYDLGEDFFDFNTNAARDVADAVFNGVCDETANAQCAAPALQSAGIGEQNLIILSGSSATITPTPANISMAPNSAQAISFWVRDVNGNVMPGGTTVGLAASGSAGVQVTQPNQFAVPCSTIQPNVQFNGVTLFQFTVTSSTTTGSGIVTLTVTTPGPSGGAERVTIAQVPVTVM